MNVEETLYAIASTGGESHVDEAHENVWPYWNNQNQGKWACIKCTVCHNILRVSIHMSKMRSV